MSDIIIKGKNLDDITQSNYQTVGPKGTLYFPSLNLYSDLYEFLNHGTRSQGVGEGNKFTPYYDRPDGYFFDEGNFIYDSIDQYAIDNGLLDNGITPVPNQIKFTSAEPWQGRLNYGSELEDLDELISGSSGPTLLGQRYTFNLQSDDSFIPLLISTGLRSDNYPSGVDGQDMIYQPFFYNGDVFISNKNLKDPDRLTPIKATLSNRLDYIFGRHNYRGYTYGLDLSNEPFYKTEDNRFSLGTITENDKEYWEIQTIDPKTRESQFGNPKMQIAVSAEIAPQETTPTEVVTSDEEFFSVDTFVYTQRPIDDNPTETKITPLFFYYDKKLHNERYNLATNGKVFMKIELRESGRDVNNHIDNYIKREPYRPFLLGFDKEEQLQGTGEVDGEGLYNLDQRVMLTSLPSADSYSSGIFDSDDNLLTTDSQFILNMPNEDVQFLSRFRPNPLVQVIARYTDIDTNELIVGTEDAKGLLKITPISETGSFQTSSQAGEFVETTRFKPTDFGGEEYLIDQQEITSNYSFTGFSFVSSSDLLTELPLDIIGGVEVESGQTFRLREDFHTPLLTISQDKADFFNRDPVTPILKIYADYKTTTFRYRNLNNFIDFENNFADALKYGPVKFYIYRGWDETKLYEGETLDYNLYGLAEYPEVAYQYQDEVVIPLWGSSDDDPRLTISSFNPGNSVGENGESVNNGLDLRIPDGYTYGEFYLHQGDSLPLFFGDGTPKYDGLTILNEDEIPLVDGPGPQPLQPTFANAVNFINDGESPPSGGTDNLSIGSRFGNNDVFILTDRYEDQQNSDEYYTEYVYEWGVDESVFAGLIDDNFDRYQSNIQLKYSANDTNFHDRQSVRIFGSIDESTNLLDTNEFNTQLLNQEVTHSFSHQPHQLGTYVKCINDGGLVETNFIPLNSDGIVRSLGDSGAIGANMFGFGEEVTFQVIPNEPAEEPVFQVWTWVETVSGQPAFNLYQIGEMPLTSIDKEQMGISFEWDADGNVGTLSYQLPESRDILGQQNTNDPLPYFKYVEFRFTTFPLEEQTGEESGEGPLVLINYISSGNNGTITGPDSVVQNESEFPKTFFINANANSGYDFDGWILTGTNSANAEFIGNPNNSTVQVRVTGPGVTTIRADWTQEDDDDDYGGS